MRMLWDPLNPAINQPATISRLIGAIEATSIRAFLLNIIDGIIRST